LVIKKDIIGHYGPAAVSFFGVVCGSFNIIYYYSFFNMDLNKIFRMGLVNGGCLNSEEQSGSIYFLTI
jgi:hypothetical protein